MALELQKPVDRRFKSDHPHTFVLIAGHAAATAAAMAIASVVFYLLGRKRGG